MGQTSQEVLEQLEYQVSVSTKILQHELRDLWGHVSARLPGGEGFLIKYLRHPMKDSEDPAEVSMFDFNGKQLRGTRVPPMEIVIHQEFYKQRPDVGCVIHAHPQTVIALSIADQEVLPLHHQSAIFSPKVPIYPKPHWVTTEDMMRDIIQFMGDSRAVALKGHGAITVGPDVIDATASMVYLEKTAQMQAIAAAIGKVTPLPLDIQEQGTKRKGNEGSIGIWKAWEEHFQTGRFW